MSRDPSEELVILIISAFALIGFGVTVKFFSDNAMPGILRWLRRPRFDGNIVSGLLVTLLFGGVAAQTRPGVPPQGMSCPVSHPIKGNFTTYSGERCIYHVLGGEFYDKTQPERCYASEADAVKDGCRRSKR